MNEQLILEQYQQITIFLEKSRLNEALAHIEALLQNCNNWELSNRLEQVQTTYQYMLQYMRQGVKDPDRSKVYKKLSAEAWEIADQARIKLLDEVSSHFYHTLRRNPNKLSVEYDLAHLQKVLEGFSDEMAVCRLTPGYQGLDEILKRHEETYQILFLITWSNSHWSSKDATQAHDILHSELVPVNDLCLFVSAITLSLMEAFDEQKVNWLLDATRHTSTQVNQRALIGLLLTLHIYSNRIGLYPELKSRIILCGEDTSFSKQVNRIYIQLLRSQETEKIDKKMRDEIIPEMMKSASIMRNIKFGFEETEENDFNPDWDEVFEKSGLGDKMREMNELQMEGSDVYMSTFAQLKSYPFFREPHNWFYPFDVQNSSVIHQVGLNPSDEKSILSIILRSGFFCNSDKYSFCFTIAQMPQSQREIIFSQMAPQDQLDLMEEKNAATMKNFSESAEVISNQYIHDLYRFFKLSQRRGEFRNIFQEEIALHRNPVLKEMLQKPEYIADVADFHFKKEHPVEALELYRLLIEYKKADANIFQKVGFCLQKEKRYQEAIDAYLKADVLKPDNLWTLRHIAACLRQIKNYSAALEYYHKVETIQPENNKILFYIGSCYAEQGEYDEALQYFFKLDYLENNCIKAWRGIGWCSFVNGKTEQAMKYYDKILAAKPLATDYLNAGHVAWKLGDIERAVALYSKVVEESGSREAFITMFERDQNSLIKQGISPEDIPLMLDMI